MNLEQLKKIKLSENPYPIAEHTEHDEFGDYLTGTFRYGNIIVIVSHDNNRWHLSAKARNPFGLHQISKLRYMFIPNNVKMSYHIPQRGYDNYERISLWEE